MQLLERFTAEAHRRMTRPARSTIATRLGLLGLVLFGIVAAIGAAELAARSMTGPARIEAEVPREFLRELPEIRSVMRLASPDVEGIHNGAYFRTNSAGFRGPEFTPLPAPGVFRIMVLGDSVAMGSGVDNDAPYPARLEEILEARYPEQEFEVLNTGLAGLGISQIWRRALRYVPVYNPHLVIYGVTLNDIEGPHYIANSEPGHWYATTTYYDRFSRSESRLLRLLWPRLVSMHDLLWPADDSYAAELRRNYFDNPEAWTDFERAMGQINRLCESRQVRLVVFTHTKLWYLNRFHPFRPIYAKIAKPPTDLGVPVIHSFDALLGYDGESLSVSRFDPHPNAVGHRILAGALADGLARLPAGYFPPGDTPGSE